MVMKPPPFKKQEGVGLVEVLMAAAILSLTVGGTILAASRWVKTTSGTSMRNDGSQINGSVMELAAYNPDATWVASQLPTTDASNTTFTISSWVTTSVGTASATQILAGTAWQDADGDGSQVNPSLQYEGTVLAETWNQTIADLVSATPSPGPESSPSPEPEPEPSPWTAGVQFNVTSNGGSGKYEYSVRFADGSTCTNPNGGQSGSFTCQTSTSLATLGVSGTADASQVLCSITRASPYAQTLSTAAPTLTVTLVVAQNSNQC